MGVMGNERARKTEGGRDMRFREREREVSLHEWSGRHHGIPGSCARYTRVHRYLDRCTFTNTDDDESKAEEYEREEREREIF